MDKKALITGITGPRYAPSSLRGRQDGSYFTPLDRSKRKKCYLVKYILGFNIQPNEIYNLGAQSHVKVSFEVPEYTADVDAMGTLRFIDAIKETGIRTKFYQEYSSELYG